MIESEVSARFVRSLIGRGCRVSLSFVIIGRRLWLLALKLLVLVRGLLLRRPRRLYLMIVFPFR